MDGPETIFGFVKRLAGIAYERLRSKVPRNRKTPLVIDEIDGILIIRGKDAKEAIEVAEAYLASKRRGRAEA